jgi:hypothetical protein
MADDSLMKDGGIAGICIILLGGIGYGLRWIGQKIWDMMMRQINERIEQMDRRINALEKELAESKDRECHFYDCPEGRPCAKIVRSFTMEDATNVIRKPKNEVRFLTPETSGDGSMTIRKAKK